MIFYGFLAGNSKEAVSFLTDSRKDIAMHFLCRNASPIRVNQWNGILFKKLIFLKRIDNGI